MTDARAGMLLVATPALIDPNFADTVVLLLDVDEQGALGVVLNRPSAVRVGDVLDAWAGAVDEPDVLFQGGPVGTEGALAVAVLRDAADVPVGFRAVDEGTGSVSAWSTSTPPSSCSRAASPGCGSSPGTPAGAPTSSRARSRRAAGTSSRPRPPTRSATTPPSSGATCCAASPASWPGTRRARSTRSSTDVGWDP